MFDVGSSVWYDLWNGFELMKWKLFWKDLSNGLKLNGILVKYSEWSVTIYVSFDVIWIPKACELLWVWAVV